MNIVTTVVLSILAVLFSGFIFYLFYLIMINLINGRKFHHSLEQQFNKLRLSNMLIALGINKSDYIYQTNIQDIKQQMKNCIDCENTGECDERLVTSDIDVNAINFCNNESELIDIKKQQAEEQAKKN